MTSEKYQFYDKNSICKTQLQKNIDFLKEKKMKSLALHGWHRAKFQYNNTPQFAFSIIITFKYRIS